MGAQYAVVGAALQVPPAQPDLPHHEWLNHEWLNHEWYRVRCGTHWVVVAGCRHVTGWPVTG